MSRQSGEKRGCLYALLSLFLGDTPTRKTLPYRVRDDFLSPAERSFYHVLKSVLYEDMVLCPKVGLKDIFFVTQPNENYSYHGRISQKHVDFLVCDAKTMHPLLGIELDDASHARADRRTRDVFVDKVFQAAGLPMLHIRAQRAYNAHELRETLERTLQPTVVAGALGSPASASYGPPSCPKCGAPMVLRTSTRGGNAGRQFYGCPNYPNCREIRPVT